MSFAGSVEIARGGLRMNISSDVTSGHDFDPIQQSKNPSLAKQGAPCISQEFLTSFDFYFWGHSNPLERQRPHHAGDHQKMTKPYHLIVFSIGDHFLIKNPFFSSELRSESYNFFPVRSSAPNPTQPKFRFSRFWAMRSDLVADYRKNR